MKIKNHFGFTMMELMIVVVIIGVLAGLAAPHFTEAIQRIRWRGTAGDITKALRLARSSAIAQNGQFGVNFDQDSHVVTVFKDLVNKSSFSYDEEGDSVVSVDSVDAHMDYLYPSFASGAICFFPNGRGSETGYIYGTSYGESHYQMFSISVLAATGRASIDYMEN